MLLYLLLVAVFFTICASVTDSEKDGYLTPQDFDNIPKFANLPENVTDSKFFEGDIQQDEELSELVPGQMPGEKSRSKRALVEPSYDWGSSTIEYKLRWKDYGKKERATIAAAFKHIEDRTCIRFVRWKGIATTPYIYFRKGRGPECASATGKSPYGGAKQKIKIAANCLYTGGVLHELMHRLGFWHEHTRQDRDQFVTVIKDNIEPGKDTDYLNHWDFKEFPYDYASITHYDQIGLSKNKLATVEPTDRSALIGQRMGLSQTDVKKLNSKFGCGLNYVDHAEYAKEQNRARKMLEKAGGVRIMPDLLIQTCPQSLVTENTCEKWVRLGYCGEHAIAAACPKACGRSGTCKRWANYGYCGDPYKVVEMKWLCFCTCIELFDKIKQSRG